MLVKTKELLQDAADGGYAIGAFNVYNLEGAKAVVAAATATNSPAMLQIHPSALAYGEAPLVKLCLSIADEAGVPMTVHLDHSSSKSAILAALDIGISSVMADGSHLSFAENVVFSKDMVTRAHACGRAVEAELGRISGTEDGLTVSEFEERFTNPAQAATFVTETGIDALAVCIGNVHGRYHHPPQLDFERLSAIREAVTVPLVLHGASGLPAPMTQKAIQLGITKLNVNTEVRRAYLGALQEKLQADPTIDLLPLMDSAVTAMQAVVTDKIRLFGSAGKA